MLHQTRTDWKPKRYYKRGLGSLGRFLSNPLDYSEVKLNLNSFNYPTEIGKKREAEKNVQSVCADFFSML